MRSTHIALLLLLLMAGLQLRAQHDSTRIRERIRRIEEDLKNDSLLRKKYEDMTFYYLQMFPRQASKGEEPFNLSGYVDAYYALYSDEAAPGQYQKFPTAAPRNHAFSLNMVQLSGHYRNDRLRAAFTLHYGDIPDAAWSPVYNMVQEANAGLRLLPKVWLDAGLFRTHLGFESIQPRENITTSIATTTYFEPYYLSGAKLSVQLSNKLTVQANVFNGFNTFIETNHNKAVGFSAVYEFTRNFIATYNNLYCDESKIGERSRNRLYHNFYLAYRSPRWDIGAEYNFGSQQHSKLNDSNATAYMMSALAAIKYKMKQGRYAVYARGEIFEDSDEILTGPVENANHALVGINLWGVTAGLEYKPLPNSYIRLEGRGLVTTKSELIFVQKGDYVNQRYEGILSFGVWF